MHVVPRLISSDPACPLRSAVLAPLIVQGRRAGTLIAFYRAQGRPRGDVLRVVAEAASLVSAQLELSVVREQEERLAQAELRALRAQISPHFIYNALAAVAGDIHREPEDARERLIDFAEFTRYLFRDGRSYVTLEEELAHVERYLRLEQARFRGSLHITVDVPAETRAPWCPRSRSSRWSRTLCATGSSAGPGSGRVTISARVRDGDVELRVSDDGSGIAPERVARCWPAPAAGSGSPTSTRGCGRRSASATALRIESRLGSRHDRDMTRAQSAGRAGAGGPRGRGRRREQRPADAARRRRRALAARGSGPDAARLAGVREVECAADGREALHRITRQTYDGIFLDVRMPDLDGLELARVLRRFARPPQLVFV